MEFGKIRLAGLWAKTGELGAKKLDLVIAFGIRINEGFENLFGRGVHLRKALAAAILAFKLRPKSDDDRTANLYRLPVADDYWARQLQKPLYPYVDGLLKQYCAPKARVLEVGCGAGRVLLPLADQGYQVWGADIAHAPLVLGQQAAQQKKLSVHWLEGDAQNLALPDRGFDAVLVLEDFLSLFHGEERRRKILQEAERVLSDDGILLLSNQNAWLEPTWRHALHYGYCRLFVYPLPDIFSLGRWREFAGRLRVYLNMKLHLAQNTNRDVLLTREVVGTLRTNAPYHIYHLKELRRDLNAAGFDVLDEKDVLEFEKNIRLPALVRSGAAKIALVARKRAKAAGRSIYEISPERRYFEHQEQKGLQPYIGGMLAQWQPPPAKILEIGCEAGRTTFALSARGYQMTALDISTGPLAHAVQRAREKKVAPAFVRADVRALPLCPEVYDVVLLTRQILSIFHGRENRLHVLRQAWRTLKPGGLLLLSIQNGALDFTLWHLLHYLYCRLFVYPLPRLSTEKWRSWGRKVSGLVRAKLYLKTHHQAAQSKDIWMTTVVSENLRPHVPFHIYHLQDIRADLNSAGFHLLDVRDFLEFEKSKAMPRWLLRGAPYLVLAAQKPRR